MKRTSKRKRTSPVASELLVGTLQELASIFGVSLRTVESWRLQGMPGRRPRGWSVSDAVRWRVLRAEADRKGADPVDKATAEARLRRLVGMADRIEWENDERARLLIPAAECESRLRERMTAFVSILNQIPGGLLPRLQGMHLTEQQAVAADWIRSYRRSMFGGEGPDPRGMTDSELAQANRPKQTFRDWHTLINALNVTGRLQEFQKTGVLPEGVVYEGEFPESFKKRVAEAQAARAAAEAPGLQPRRARDSEAAELADAD